MNQKAGSAADLRAVQFPDEACECGVGPNAEFESPSVRLDYSSLVSPPSTLDYDPASQTLTLVKQKEVSFNSLQNVEDSKEGALWSSAVTA